MEMDRRMRTMIIAITVVDNDAVGVLGLLTHACVIAVIGDIAWSKHD
jgi:hypothetical protein